MRIPVLNLQDTTIESDLVKVCERVLRSIVIAPGIVIEGISASCIQSARFDSAEKRRIFVVRISTNDATMVRGDKSAYKGSYKERIEGVLDFYAKSRIPNSEVHLEIDGPNTRTVERLVPVQDLERYGVVWTDSPIVVTAKRFTIPDILLRGRHLVAPSPAVAAYLEFLLQREPVKTAVDLFGGTGLTASVLCALGDPDFVTVVECDESRLERMQQHVRDRRVRFVGADAFEYALTPCDLIVADPYYEDALRFLDARLEAILNNARIFVFVPGKIEDIRWNDEVERRLVKGGATARRWERFGQVIFDVRP